MSPTSAPPQLEYQAYAGEVPGNAEQVYTGIAIFDGSQWASLCRELDVASVGSTAQDALVNLEAAVRDLLAYSHETGRPVGPGVSDHDLRAFMLSHRGPIPGAVKPFLA